MISEKSNRIGYIDFLKVIGLTGIILAHVGSPDWVLFLRSFDVPLMVILSAVLGEMSFQKIRGANKIREYFISRFKRLVLPVWIFLVFYFLLKLFVTKQPETIKYYVASFLLTRYGIGYVWIILIYLYCAILVPICSRSKIGGGYCNSYNLCPV